jgi:hypothetical protein
MTLSLVSSPVQQARASLPSASASASSSSSAKQKAQPTAHPKASGGMRVEDRFGEAGTSDVTEIVRVGWSCSSVAVPLSAADCPDTLPSLLSTVLHTIARTPTLACTQAHACPHAHASTHRRTCTHARSHARTHSRANRRCCDAIRLGRGRGRALSCFPDRSKMHQDSERRRRAGGWAECALRLVHDRSQHPSPRRHAANHRRGRRARTAQPF